MTLGKSFDTCGPLGPWLVTSDEIADPHNLAIKPGLMMNCGRIPIPAHDFNCYEMIAYLSQAMTLEPGDVIPRDTQRRGVKMQPRGI